MSNIEHALETAIAYKEAGKTFAKYIIAYEKLYANEVHATPQELWWMADYVINNYKMWEKEETTNDGTT